MSTYHIIKYSDEDALNYLNVIKMYLFQSSINQNKYNKIHLYESALGSVGIIINNYVSGIESMNEDYFQEWCDVNHPDKGGNKQLYDHVVDTWYKLKILKSD